MYEYSCASCGHQDTLLEKVGAPENKKCPTCGKARAFKRQLSAPSFHLKGTGWYATDFRDNGKAKNHARDAKEGKDTTSDSKQSTEAVGDKPAVEKPAADKAESSGKASKAKETANA